MTTVLQVLICTFGPEGIKRVAAGKHPRVEGVGYIVSWQRPGSAPVPGELERDDFRIIRHDSAGLSRNRNEALKGADAPFCLIADDDLDFDADALRLLMQTMPERPDTDVFLCRSSGNIRKPYPRGECGLGEIPRGWYVTSVEIALRRATAGRIRFNENFGIGGRYFPAGEEDVWLMDLLDKGLSVRFLPLTVSSHTGETTGSRAAYSPGFIAGKGAIVFRRFPLTWPLRLLARLREVRPERDGIGRMAYLKAWMKGIGITLRHRVWHHSPS